MCPDCPELGSRIRTITKERQDNLYIPSFCNLGQNQIFFFGNRLFGWFFDLGELEMMWEVHFWPQIVIWLSIPGVRGVWWPYTFVWGSIWSHPKIPIFDPSRGIFCMGFKVTPPYFWYKNENIPEEAILIILNTFSKKVMRPERRKHGETPKNAV